MQRNTAVEAALARGRRTYNECMALSYLHLLAVEHGARKAETNRG